MSEKEIADSVVVHDSAERRRFMRRGAAFVAAAGVAATGAGRSAIAASDCDRGGPGGKKPEHAGNGSDSDTGANADPTGCGRNYEDKPKISQLAPRAEPGAPRRVKVAKISG